MFYDSMLCFVDDLSLSYHAGKLFGAQELLSSPFPLLQPPGYVMRRLQCQNQFCSMSLYKDTKVLES